MTSYNPLELEPEVLSYWEKQETHKKANEQNKNGKPFYFLDGPPYTSGKVHIGTAWNKSLKDFILRYKRMCGFHTLDRAGYDMHGLPTENATEKKLKISGKDEIIGFGVDNFVKACKELSIHNLKVMNKDFERLGVWMDFENAYQSVSREYISGEWWLVKQAHEKGRLYEGFRSMAWDWAHQTALAKHELEYKKVTDTSIYVKMPLKGKKNEFFIIWTTTPWTIAFNLGIMVNPHLDYVKAQVGEEIWIVAKELAHSVIEQQAKKKFEIVETVKGEKLAGVEYVHPFHDELKTHYAKIKKDHPNTHTIVLSEEFVTTEAGSGLVHMAPGCGPEDYEVGHRNSIPPWNLVTEDGHYPKNMGTFAGRHTIKDNGSFIKDLDRLGFLIAKQKVTHDYPHGQRSHQPVIFRATKQWFFKVEDLKKKLIAENDKVHWVPEAGYNAFNSWLHNLRDNSISKQRYWGTPLPIWRNEEDPNDYFVVGSVAELENMAAEEIREPHIPWIDDIVVVKDGKTYKRVPDVLDVWVDAGCASWNSLNFPQEKEDFKKFFPADFILEGKDQIRGWFNLLHIASFLAHGKASFKAVYMHGFVQDAQGRKMSKSLGNYILPEEVIAQYGADTLRYYMIGGANAGVDINYNFEDMKVRHKNLNVLWNIHNYLLEFARTNKVDPKHPHLEGKLGVEEKYILSKMHSAIKKATVKLDQYKLDEVPSLVEELFLELSRTYLQLTREKAALGTEEEKGLIFSTAYLVFMNILKLFAPIAPFITEKMYLNFREELGLGGESIHLMKWPKSDNALIDRVVEHNMAVAQSLVQATLAAREKIHLGVRWPLPELVVVTQDAQTAEAVERMKDIIKIQTNVKLIKVQKSMANIQLTVKPDFAKLGPDFGENSPKIVGKIAMESPQSILEHIEKEGKFVCKIDGKEFPLVKEHLIVNRHVPEPYQEGSFKGSFFYLNKEMTLELEAEGYARELTRRVQALRKKAGLRKTQRIDLYLKMDKSLSRMLAAQEPHIKEKVGAVPLRIGETTPEDNFEHHSEEKVKGKTFEIFFSLNEPQVEDQSE